MPLKTPKLKCQKQESRFRQTVLDAGQSKIGLVHCQKCGMIYNVDDKSDVEQHVTFHNRFADKKSLKVAKRQLDVWKKLLCSENVNAPLPGIIFRLNGFSTATLKRKFEDVIENYVNKELGYCSDSPIWGAENLRQAFVFVVAASPGEPAFIGGIILLERVNEVMLMPEQKVFRGQFLGVNRIWVHSQLRRRGIASSLLDIARKEVCSSGMLPKSSIAFNEPTADGSELASAYVREFADESEGRMNKKYVAY